MGATDSMRTTQRQGQNGQNPNDPNQRGPASRARTANRVSKAAKASKVNSGQQSGSQGQSTGPARPVSQGGQQGGANERQRRRRLRQQLSATAAQHRPLRRPGRPYGWRGGYWDPYRGRLNGWNPPLPRRRSRPSTPRNTVARPKPSRAACASWRTACRKAPSPTSTSTPCANSPTACATPRTATRWKNEYARMVGLVDQLELRRAERLRENQDHAPRAPRARQKTRPSIAETVAEYYRRLGNDSK